MSQVDLQTLLSTIYAAPSINAQGQQFSQGIGPAASIAARVMQQQQTGQPWQAPNLDNLLLNILPRWGGSSTGGGGTGGSSGGGTSTSSRLGMRTGTRLKSK